MSERTSNVTKAPASRGRELKRVCAAPREVVFKAWTAWLKW